MSERKPLSPINMPRGDRREISFVVRDRNGTIVLDLLDEVYVTVKKRFTDEAFLFQKRLSSGTITQTEDGVYHFTIEPDDTNGLAFGEYVFDIEIIRVGTLKETRVGKLNIMQESTWAVNEVT